MGERERGSVMVFLGLVVRQLRLRRLDNEALLLTIRHHTPGWVVFASALAGCMCAH